MSSYTRRLAAWLLTDSGKTFTACVAGATVLGVTAVKTLPHTIFIDQYKNFVHLYKNGMPVPVPKEVQEKFNKAIDLIEMPEIERDIYNPFMVIGFDVISAGSSYSRFGVSIGVPVNFTYKDVDSIDMHSIKLRTESIPWITDEGKLLLNSLVLSENAQLYGLAREIKMRDSAKFFLDTFYAAASCFGYYGFTNYFNNKANLYARPLAIRVIMYSLVGTFMCGNYFFLKDFTQNVYEEKVDSDLKAQNPIFAEGGKEFYDKLLQRNMALRKLLGKEGERQYTSLGNENYLLRQRHLPLVQRRDFFEQKM